MQYERFDMILDSQTYHNNNAHKSLRNFVTEKFSFLLVKFLVKLSNQLTTYVFSSHIERQTWQNQLAIFLLFSHAVLESNQEFRLQSILAVFGNFKNSKQNSRPNELKLELIMSK